jgi:hypothetical protein
MTAFGAESATFFGLSRVLDASERERLEDFLRTAWTAQYSRPPGSLAADLQRLGDLFGADATPKRLRNAVSKLRRVPQQALRPPEMLWVAIDSDRGLVTPEGRVALEQLRVLREEGRDTISSSEVSMATATVADAYREWQRAWLDRHLSGAGLRPGSYGWVLLLLVNGSTRREQALRLPAEQDQERKLAGVLMPVIDAFAEPLGGEPQSMREGSRLRSNWRVTQARALLFGLVQRADEDGDAYFWVEPEDQLVDELGRRLAARRDLDPETLSRAVDALIASYSNARPALSAFGVAHDRSAHTRRVAQALVDAFTHERTSA